MKNYLLATRPKTLLVSLSVCLVSLGVVINQLQSAHLFLNTIILFCVLSLHIMVNYLNDLLDAQRRKDTSKRLGPLRYVQAELISPYQMKKVSFFILLLMLPSGVWLVWVGGPFILFLGVFSILLTYFYSAPPVSIADHGLAEVFVFLFFGVLASMGIFHLNYSFMHPFDTSFLQVITPVLVAGSQGGLLSASLAVVNHIRDIEEDSRSGKRTLVVRFGLFFGRMEWLFCVSITFALGLYWALALSNTLAFFWPMIILPLYVWIGIKIFTQKPSRNHNYYLALTSLAQFLFSIFLFLALTLHG